MPEQTAEFRGERRRGVERRRSGQGIIDQIWDIVDSVGTPEGLEGVGELTPAAKE